MIIFYDRLYIIIFQLCNSNYLKYYYYCNMEYILIYIFYILIKVYIFLKRNINNDIMKIKLFLIINGK